eukprot:8618304-Pyramimonas_sp.AAC.4
MSQLPCCSLQSEVPASVLLAEAGGHLKGEDLEAAALQASLCAQAAEGVKALFVPPGKGTASVEAVQLAAVAGEAVVAALGSVWSLAVTATPRSQLVDLGAHKRVLCLLLALVRHTKGAPLFCSACVNLWCTTVCCACRWCFLVMAVGHTC